MLLNSHFYFLFQLSILKSKEYLNNSNQNKLVYDLLLIKLVMVCDSQNYPPPTDIFVCWICWYQKPKNDLNLNDNYLP